MKNRLYVQPVNSTIRHYMRVMAFVVLGIICGAILSSLVSFTVEMYSNMYIPSVLNTGSFENTQPQHLQKMSGAAAVPLLFLVLFSLVSFGVLYALNEPRPVKGNSPFSIHQVFH